MSDSISKNNYECIDSTHNILKRKKFSLDTSNMNYMRKNLMKSTIKMKSNIRRFSTAKSWDTSVVTLTKQQQKKLLAITKYIPYLLIFLDVYISLLIIRQKIKNVDIKINKIKCFMLPNILNSFTTHSKQSIQEPESD